MKLTANHWCSMQNQLERLGGNILKKDLKLQTIGAEPGHCKTNWEAEPSGDLLGGRTIWRPKLGLSILHKTNWEMTNQIRMAISILLNWERQYY